VPKIREQKSELYRYSKNKNGRETAKIDEASKEGVMRSKGSEMAGR